VSYHEAQRVLQDRFDTRRLADRLAEGTSQTISAQHKRFIEDREMFFLATSDSEGWPECSYKGGDKGFVRVIDESTLTFPVYDGNGMFLSCGNLMVNPRVGMLFVNLESGTRLRLNGEASLDPDDPLVETYPGAKMVVRVRTHKVFVNCRRYVHRYQLVRQSPFVPSPEGDAPVPDWKLDPWFEGTLPASDPANDPSCPTAEAIPQFED
jgi:predicted pyridoxine 5'-phosphate oxidase superfamily flavin-nucleotide-binding protein